MSAHHELAILRCLCPASPSCIQPLRLFSFLLLPFGYSCLVGFPLSFFARTNVRPRPEYSVWRLVCPLLFGRGFEAGVAHSWKTVVRASRSSAPTVEVRGRRIRIRPNGVAGQTRQPSIDGRPICLVEVLVCYFLLWSCGNRRRIPQAVWSVVSGRGPVYD